MFLIIGLGNPGLKYAKTRHNAGFMAVDAIASAKNIDFDRLQKHALTATYFENGNKVLLAKPQTYMNNSGQSLRELVDYYQIPLENVLVIYDDIDLELGQTRIRKKGGAGTHNGMRSIIAELGSGDFPRLRCGIGPQPEFWDLADFVLSAMNEAQLEKMGQMCELAVSCADYFVTEGLDIAMNRLNSRPKKKKKTETVCETETEEEKKEK